MKNSEINWMKTKGNNFISQYLQEAQATRDNVSSTRPYGDHRNEMVIFVKDSEAKNRTILTSASHMRSVKHTKNYFIHIPYQIKKLIESRLQNVLFLI